MIDLTRELLEESGKTEALVRKYIEDRQLLNIVEELRAIINRARNFCDRDLRNAPYPLQLQSAIDWLQEQSRHDCGCGHAQTDHYVAREGEPAWCCSLCACKLYEAYPSGYNG